MNDHPRETTLELFVLGSESLTDPDRDDIGRHLEVCAGCRALVETMREFYASLRSDLGTIGGDFSFLSPEAPSAEAHPSSRARNPMPRE
jgi:hypothetical protein